jgi:hypothetical protein
MIAVRSATSRIIARERLAQSKPHHHCPAACKPSPQTGFSPRRVRARLH